VFNATLPIVKPPKIYSLFWNTANPPGRFVPPELPGQLSAAVNGVIVSLTGL
jgi:hypothetical protein